MSRLVLAISTPRVRRLGEGISSPLPYGLKIEALFGTEVFRHLKPLLGNRFSVENCV